MDDDVPAFESTMPLAEALALADKALARHEEGDHIGYLQLARKIPLPPALALDIARSPFLGGGVLAERFGDQLADLEKYDAQGGF